MSESLPLFDESVIQSEEEPIFQDGLDQITEEDTPLESDTSALNLHINMGMISPRASVEVQTQTKKPKKVVAQKVKDRHEKLA